MAELFLGDSVYLTFHDNRKTVLLGYPTVHDAKFAHSVLVDCKVTVSLLQVICAVFFNTVRSFCSSTSFYLKVCLPMIALPSTKYLIAGYKFWYSNDMFPSIFYVLVSFRDFNHGRTLSIIELSFIIKRSDRCLILFR